MSDYSALASFLEKWRHRWPEWSVAETFVPAARRDCVVAWFSLLLEFEDAMNITGDPLPADAKLAWWTEELRSWQNRRSRHPLGRLLEPVAAPWAALGDALPVIVQARSLDEDRDAAFTVLRDYGESVAAVEVALLGASTAPDALIAQLLAQRLAEQRLADSTMVDAGLREAMRRNAEDLLARWPSTASGARERRMFARFARTRLQGWATQGTAMPLPSRWRLLLGSWHAARGTPEAMHVLHRRHRHQ